MIYACEADIVPLVKNLVKAFKPYARVNQVWLNFFSNEKAVKIVHEPYTLLQSVSRLLLQVIHLTPSPGKVEVRLQSQPESGTLVIEIENNGINLIQASGMFLQGAHLVTGHGLQNGTVYRFALPMHNKRAVANELRHTTEAPCKLPKFYADMKKRLRSHFTLHENRRATVGKTQQIEASFLQKVNTLIKANLHDEHFDTSVLCKAVSMSRTQLFRRLKPLVRQAPAAYIKTLRLQNARELLEITELTVSEVAFKCGFNASSHFTKVFQRKYGLLPSFLQRSRHATND